MKKFNTHAPLYQRTIALCLLVLFALVTGCSSVRFSYNQGDTLLYWWLDSYVDLEGQQADTVKRDIDKLFQWHRQTQLPDYAALLGKMQKQVAGNPSQADVIDLYKEIRARGERLTSRAVPELTTLALSITPEQIANIERKFHAKNAEYREKFMEGSPEKRKSARFKKAMKQLEQWFGNFSKEQEAILRKTVDARPLDNQQWLEERVWRQRRILSLLRKFQQEKPTREQAEAQVAALQRELFRRTESPERKALYDAGVEHTSNLILTALRIATPAQKQHAQERIQGWINDFQALAAGK